MAERVRVTTDCDGLRAAHAGSEKLVRFGVGSELPLLRDDDRDFYEVAFAGQPIFLPKSCAFRIQSSLGGEASTILQPPAQRLALPVAPAPVSAARPVRRRYRRPRSRSDNGWVITAARVTGLVIGLIMAAIGVGLIIAAAPSVLSPDTGIGTGYGIGLAGGGVLAISLALVRITYRSLLQLILGLSGLVLAIGGFQLLIIAIPLVRMTGIDIDADRAKLAFPIEGGVLRALGIAMVVFALVRWLRNPQSRRRWPDVARWSALIFGGLLVTASSGAPISVSARAADYTPTLQDAAATGAVVALTLLPGAVLGYHGLTMARHRPEGPFRFLPAGVLFAAFGLVVALGAIVVAVEEPLIWLMSPLHAAAALLPAVALIALVSRAGPGMSPPIAGLTHRQLWLALAVGIVVVTTVAGTLDSFIAEALGMSFLALSGAFDGLRDFEHLGDVLADADLYLSRRYQIFLLLSVVVIMAPVMEEGFKALGLALVMPRRPSPSAALTLGVAVGAGFGVLEATLYGLGGLDPAEPIAWWSLMLIRAGATSMHALNTGLLGLALYYDRSEGRLRRAFLLYLAAVTLHGVWNALAVFAGSRVIFSFEGLTDEGLAWVIFAAMMLLGLVVLAILYAVARRAYHASPKVDGTPKPPPALSPTPTLQPWRG